jgi:ATP-binding cassette subfamily F protein uup
VARIDFTATGRRTKRLVSVENLAMEMGGRTLFRDLSFALVPGARLGLLGANGAGKTTLLRILAGELEPSEGRCERAPALRSVYFDQTREQLDATRTLREGLGAHGENVVFRDRPIHVAGWARRFLFDADQLDRPISSLSGGEQARVLIARLMLQPADLLLLDEPTNDLDIPTLEILEESLLEYAGALVLVTHDRYMLDRVSTIVLGLDGMGNAETFADYSQWEQWQREQGSANSDGSSSSATATAAQAVPQANSAGKKKLSYLEAREYASIEDRVEAAEERLNAARDLLDDPGVATNAVALTAALHEMEQAQAASDELYARWAELTEKAG